MMKKTIIGALFILSTSLSLSAGNEFEEVFVKPYKISLSEQSFTDLWLRWDYAGPISGFCRLELSTDGSIETILQELDFDGREIFYKDANNAQFKLQYSTYVDWIRLSVKSGETLKSTLENLGLSLSVRVLPCEPEDHR